MASFTYGEAVVEWCVASSVRTKCLFNLVNLSALPINFVSYKSQKTATNFFCQEAAAIVNSISISDLCACVVNSTSIFSLQPKILVSTKHASVDTRTCDVNHNYSVMPFLHCLQLLTDCGYLSLCCQNLTCQSHFCQNFTFARIYL